MKNNAFFLIFLALVSIFFYRSIDSVRGDLRGIFEKQNEIYASVNAIFTKINADENERLSALKLQRNLEVWQGTGCIECHNTLALALPMRKQTISEAINIVRVGTNKSLEGGMPLYNARNTRGRDSITDSELRVRFELLYTKEFLAGVESTP